MQAGFWAMFAAICAYQAALLQGRGFSNGQVGLIIAVRCLAGIVCQPALGGFADRHPHIPLKYIVSASLGLSFVAGVIFTLLPMGMAGTLAVFVVIGGLELCEDTAELTVDGTPVKLTPLEFKILALLMKNPGRVFSAEEIYGALGTGIAECEITPVFCGSAVTGLGTIVLLDAIKNFFPYPREGGKRVDENAPAKAIVYKTISDQFGKFSLFKVIAGKVTPDMTLVNARSGAQEKLGHIYYMQGKKNIEVQEIGCGDIGAVSKLSDQDRRHPLRQQGR